MNKRWLIPETLDTRSIDIEVSPIIVKILMKRGYKTKEDIYNFLHPDVQNLHSPFLMRDMERAVEKILKAVKNRKKILIYGDYDVDGVTGTSLLVRFLRQISANVCYYIPHRRKEGYGLSLEGIRYAKKHSVDLIITVDCGSGAIEIIEEVLRAGMDIVVTDHHSSSKNLPTSVPLLNPLFDDYPFKDLSGCGVVFKFTQGIAEKVGLSIRELFWELDLVALATVCDVVPLIGENRIFVKHGMRCIQKTENKGVRALLAVSGLEGKEIDSYHLGFVLGPRINAQGRLKDAGIVVRLFTTDDEEEALKIAEKLSLENRKRIEIEKSIIEDAESVAERMKESYGYVINREDWHPGVIGIAASRIAERFYRPTVLISIADGVGKGSGRSIPEFHLYNALEECSDLFLSFGGHKFACGITIDPVNIEEFKKRFNNIAKRELKEEDLVPKIEIDVDLPLSRIDRSLIKELSLLAPHGSSNPRPTFLSTGLQVVGYPSLLKNRHLKFNIREKDTVIKAIAFRNKRLADMVKTGSIVDIVYQPVENRYNSKENIELYIKDIKVVADL